MKMRSMYMDATNRRVESMTLGGRFRGGKLVPVGCVPFLQSEGGLTRQTVSFELDKIAGRVATEMVAEVVCVFVPALAIEMLKNPDAEHLGNEQILREKYLANEAVFGLEGETEISMRMGVVPRSVAGVKQVNEMARLAHNAAINFLRRRKHVKATQLLASNTQKMRAPCAPLSIGWQGQNMM
ncbi:hypothetical protein [Ruegeria sp. Ofav3-42]|uniref:hypothetical protein n=1 Tax=Ruegeria sp. Ofav3-42 TaxID=2917759 RepID=UPI001EF538C5|nr:hypothetical protein [Ruegeria sp. Ofav3-42]MCG7521518.1 hypothetical protein [Ruegeria sp. Ofav3-42]